MCIYKFYLTANIAKRSSCNDDLYPVWLLPKSPSLNYEKQCHLYVELNLSIVE